MSFNRILNITLAALFPVLIISALFWIIPPTLLPLADSGSSLVSGQKDALINFSHNGFLLWQFPVAKLLGISCYPAIIAAHLILLATGTLLILAILCEIPLLLASIMGAITSFAVFCFFGLDSVSISVLSYLPWLLLSAILSWRSAVFLIVSALIVWLSAIHLGSFALFNLIIVLPIALAFRSDSFDWRSHLYVRSPTLLLSCALLLPLIPFLGGVLPAWPAYPEFAHLVPDDGVAGIPQALVGPSQPFAIIDRFELKAIFPTLIGWLVFLFALALPSRSDSSLASYIRIAFFALCAVGLADTLLPEQLVEVMPLAALARVVPGWISWPLVPLAFGAAITLMPIALSQRPIRFGLCMLLTIIAGTISLERPLPYGIVFEPSTSTAWREASSDPESRRILLSPSYSMIRVQGVWLMDLRQKTAPNAIRLARVPHQLKASHNQELLPLAVDGSSHTRWFSTGQSGSEWISIRFETAQQLSGIRLNISDFKSDFPRGITVSYQSECSEPPTPLRETTEIINHKSWQGEVLYTEAGFPYFGSQDHVEILFPKEITAQCVLLKQTAKARRFDWSIGEIALLEP